MQHGATRSDQPTVPEPTHAERARTLVRKGGNSTISTMSQRQPGYPFGSVMPYADDEIGEPLMLISSMAMHTRNLQGDPKATLLVTEPSNDMLGAGRVSLLGVASLVGANELDAARQRYLEAQPAAKQWIDYDDFQLWRLRVVDVYFVGGFGVMGWVEADEYRAAAPDPLLAVSADIIAHMNNDHAEALTLLARANGFEDVRAAQMTALDRLGFHVRMQTKQGPRGGRIAFPAEVASADACRNTFVQMVNAARGN